MSFFKVLDNYIQKQIVAGREDLAFKLAEYSGKHHNDEGHPHYYPDMYEYNAPEEVRTRFGDWIQDNADLPYHADDDRDMLWNLFIEQMEREQMDEDAQEMSFWKSQYDKENANKPLEMSREDMPHKMRMREDLYGKDERTKWNKKKDQELGAESRPTKRNSELEETESQKKKKHTTIKESQILEKRKARWASWKNKNTKTASKDIWIEAYGRIENGEETCPNDGEYLILDEKNYCGVCEKCGFKLPVDELATDIMTNHIDRDYDMFRESKNLKKMIHKYCNSKNYKEPFNGKIQDNWEDMLGRWNKYIDPDYGVSQAPKKNPCPEDEFINIQSTTASQKLRHMLKKYAQLTHDDFDTQIHPEEDPMGDEYQIELDNMTNIESLMEEYGHYYDTKELKRAFKEGLKVGIRGY